jgi:uncharacterized protein (TIGR02145 family)
LENAVVKFGKNIIECERKRKLQTLNQRGMFLTLKRKFDKLAQQWGKTVLIAFVAIFIAGSVNAQSKQRVAVSVKGDAKASSKKRSTSPKKIGVLINDIVWSPFNVGTTGKFVDNPEDFGDYYQWNRKDTTDFVLCADFKPNNYPSFWLPSNDPSPKGWRVPTLDKLNKLLDTAKVTSEWITENGINGYRFTEKSSGNSIFLPAAGFISCYNGFPRDVGHYGDYWSSTPDRTKAAHLLSFHGNEVSPRSTIGFRTAGFCVRPVAEKTKKQIEKRKRNVTVTGVKLDEISLTLEVGEYKTLIANVLPEDATNKLVSWISNDPTVAIVTSSGLITARSDGETTIIATTIGGNYTAECALTIINVNQEEEGVIVNGIKWATRNLSAHGKFAKNAEAFGALFQWGRKGDGHELRTSPNYPTNDNSDESGIVSGEQNFDSYGQIVSTHDAYGKFIKLDDSHFDWRTPSSATLWISGSMETPIKTANDPCPEGWRLPSKTELAKLGNGEWTDTPVAGRYFGSGDSLLFLPAAGYRDDRGTLINVGKLAYYWCSEQYLNYTATGYSLCFRKDNLSPYCNYSKKLGLSVRCVAEH